jgi:hypothetical protein
MCRAKSASVKALELEVAVAIPAAGDESEGAFAFSGLLG